MKISETLTFYALKASTGNGAILVDAGISAGFPSVAEDICETRIDAGLDDNDLLVIDRSLEPANNKIAVCFLDGEFTVKRLRVEKNEVWLQPENPNYPIINITAENDFVIWGIVTNVIKKV